MADSTTAQIGATVDLAFWDTAVSPDAWADLGQVRSINGVGVTKQEVDSTTLDSTAVERIGGLPDGDEVTITFTTGATNTHIDRTLGWANGTTSIDFKLTINAPATETLYFSVFPLHMGIPTIQPNDLLEIEFSGRITGGLSATPSHM